MPSKNEQLDELLQKYISEDGVSESVNAFGKMVVNSIHQAANESGYDTFEDMISNEIDMGLKNKKSQKPDVHEVKECHTRYDYFMQSFEDVEYDSRYRGNYKLGHMEALERYMDKVELNRSNLEIVEKTIKQELAFVRKQKDSSLYAKGYLDGLKMVDKALRKSKNEMMKQVYDAVMDALK